MDNVTNFTVHKNTRDKRAKRRVHNELKSSVGELNCDKVMDGFVVFSFAQEEDGTFYTRCKWYSKDSAVIPILPRLVEESLRKHMTKG